MCEQGAVFLGICSVNIFGGCMSYVTNQQQSNKDFFLT